MSIPALIQGTRSLGWRSLWQELLAVRPARNDVRVDIDLDEPAASVPSIHWTNAATEVDGWDATRPDVASVRPPSDA
jgi:hypothetical protein